MGHWQAEGGPEASTCCHDIHPGESELPRPNLLVPLAALGRGRRPARGGLLAHEKGCQAAGN